MSNQGESYENNIRKLEEIIQRLERGDLTLEEGLTAFEEGIGLVKACQKQLERVSGKLLVLQQDSESEQEER